jgi:hypothetical protein
MDKNCSCDRCKKNLVYTIDEDGKPLFSKQYLRLWTLLTYVGPYAPRGEGAIVSSFLLPKNSLSKLRGIGQITDPSSSIRLILFANETLDGPINPINPNTQFYLTTYNTAVNYEVSWKISKNNHCNKTKIAFYSSANFEFKIDNKLELISGNKGVCIFTKNTGSFVCEMIKNFYVAVDKNVLVDLEVKIVIPKKVVYPPPVYTKYIKIFDKNCKKRIIPVYTLQPKSEDFGIKKPTKYFKSEAKLIRRYLDETALSLTLFNPLNIVNSDPITFTNLGNAYGLDLASMDSSAYPQYATDNYYFVQQGLILTPPTG